MKLKNTIILLILLIGVACMAGCSSPASTTAATPTPQIVYVTVLVTQTPTASTIEATPTELSVYTSDDINKLFIDVAFSNDFQNITRISSQVVKISIGGNYNDNDKIILSNFIQQFNEHSSTTQISSEPTEGNLGLILFNFLPGSSLQSLANDKSFSNLYRKQIINTDNSGNIVSIYRITLGSSSGTANIYINSDLTGDERSHYFIRGLLYYLGFVGQTGTYPDSIFYAAPNNTTTPSFIDWDAIGLMYGKKITYGMSLSDVENLFSVMNKNS